MDASRTAIIACALLLAACGDGSSNPGPDGDVDAPSDGPGYSCWPDELDRIPRGTVEIGTGDTAFEPMPESMPIFYGGQNGFGIMVRSRMTGFAPGERQTPYPPTNPFTRLHAEFVDRDETLMSSYHCGYRTNYVTNSIGSYDVPDPIVLAFDLCWGSDALVGERIKVSVEIMDSTGSYAMDSHVIMATEPMDESTRNIPTYCGM